VFIKLFRLSTHAVVTKIQPDKVVRWRADGDFLAIFCRSVFLASRVQHILDPHSKCVLRPHYV